VKLSTLPALFGFRNVTFPVNFAQLPGSNVSVMMYPDNPFGSVFTVRGTLPAVPLLQPALTAPALTVVGPHVPTVNGASLTSQQLGAVVEHTRTLQFVDDTFGTVQLYAPLFAVDATICVHVDPLSVEYSSFTFEPAFWPFHAIEYAVPEFSD
jgi:hypothetical protein